MVCCWRLCLSAVNFFLWPKNLISMFTGPCTYVTNFGEISSNVYEDIVFAWFFGSLPAVTFWSQNLIGKSMNPNTYVPKIDWNSLHWLSVHKSTIFEAQRCRKIHTENLVNYSLLNQTYTMIAFILVSWTVLVLNQQIPSRQSALLTKLDVSCGWNCKAKTQNWPCKYPKLVKCTWIQYCHVLLQHVPIFHRQAAEIQNHKTAA